MSSYGQYCPIAKGAEIFAERWMPLIVREMMMGAHRFNQLEPRSSRHLPVPFGWAAVPTGAGWRD